jgi:hypothetical protein
MKTLQFEGVKVALKQDKTGYVLTLSMHPDDIPEDLLRDFVGARYQVVMVRLDSNEAPMDRQNEFEGDKYVRVAGMLCKDRQFWNYLYDDSQIFEENEKEATEWLRTYLGINSRADLKTNTKAREHLGQLIKEFTEWKQKS